jgi:hypothetical protein
VGLQTTGSNGHDPWGPEVEPLPAPNPDPAVPADQPVGLWLGDHVLSPPIEISSQLASYPQLHTALEKGAIIIIDRKRRTLAGIEKVLDPSPIKSG